MPIHKLNVQAVADLRNLFIHPGWNLFAKVLREKEDLWVEDLIRCAATSNDVADVGRKSGQVSAIREVFREIEEIKENARGES